jgi:hypothetical protein
MGRHFVQRMVLLILGLLIRTISSSRRLRDRKEIVSRNADPLIYKKIAFSLVHHHLESCESIFPDTPYFVATVVRVRRRDDVSNANRRSPERRSAQTIFVKTLPDRLSRPHGHYGFRLFVIAAPVVFVISNPGIADVDVAFVPVEM